MLHILKDRVSTHIIWNPSAWTICSFSLIYLDYYGLWDTYFILWVIIQQNIQFHAQIVPHLAIDCFLGGSGSKDSPAMQETWVWSLGWEDPLEKEMSTHSSVLAWRIPWTEEPGGVTKSWTWLGDYVDSYDISPSLWVFEQFCTFWHYKILHTHLLYLVPALRIIHLSKSFDSFYWRIILETKIWVLLLLSRFSRVRLCATP